MALVNAVPKFGATSSLTIGGSEMIVKNTSRAFFTSIFATERDIDNRKNDVAKSDASTMCSKNLVNFGPLMANKGTGIWTYH